MRAIGIAVFVVFLLAIIYAAFDLRRDESQISRIREECQHSHAGKMTECMTDMALRRARQPELP
jgi:hypothetical protein